MRRENREVTQIELVVCQFVSSQLFDERTGFDSPESS